MDDQSQANRSTTLYTNITAKWPLFQKADV